MTDDWLTAIANIASIATAIVAVYGYGYYRWNLRRRSKAVETLLRTKNAPGDDSLRVDQIAAALKMTIEQVIEAASDNDSIEGWEGPVGGERRLRIKRNEKKAIAKA